MKKLLITIAFVLLPLTSQANYFRVSTGSFFKTIVGRYFAVYNSPSAAPAACSPTDVAGLNAWYKADALSLNDGDNVTTWTDSSGNGNDAASQATAPVYKTSIINGKPVVRFAGSSYMNKAFTQAQPVTIFIVTKATAITEGAPAYDGFNSLTANLYPHSGDFTPYSGGFGSAVNLTWANPNVITMIWNGGSSVAAVNGTASNNATGGTPDLAGITIGAWGNGSNKWTGDIAELLVYNGALTTGNRQAVEDCLGTKYGITISH